MCIRDSTNPTASVITYGQTLSNCTLSGGSGSVEGTFGFSTLSISPNAGTSSQSVTFTPSDTTNYNTVVFSISITVNKANPTINTNPTTSVITYGQTLSNCTLSGGSASVEGTFAFSTPSISPNVGTSSQSVTFTPSDTTNYNTCLLYTSPSPRDRTRSRMPSSA